MAYLPKEKTKEIRTALKKAFPEIKFSIRSLNYSSLYVTIMKSPYFDDGVNETINHYNRNMRDNRSEATKAVLIKIDEIIRDVGNYYNNSDAMTDYFDVSFYYNIEVGKWDKPHVKTS